VLAGLGRIEVELVEENAPLVRFRKHGVPGHFHESHWPIGFCHKPGNMALGQALLNDGRGILGVEKPSSRMIPTMLKMRGIDTISQLA
jgi:hypothetical protein